MPWKDCCPMDEKLKFIVAWKAGASTMATLCRDFQISRKTGYKWVRRYQSDGVRGLEDRSHAPHHHPNAVDADTIRCLLRLKQRYPLWGPRKIRAWLDINEPELSWPSANSIGNIFQRHGWVRPRKRRQRVVRHGDPLRQAMSANELWCADFKGQFRVGGGPWCYPLTVSDQHSRYLLKCNGLTAPTEALSRPCFEAAFREYGLPAAIRTDNGAPFASTALGGLTRLVVWWLKLGIMPEQITPGHPEQNGRHERMHRTLKAATARPPKSTWTAQQRAFDGFRQEYNDDRPHESLGNVPPASHYHPSPRPYPKKLPEVEYGDEFTIRRVRSNGEIKWKGGKVYVSEALCGEPVGLTPIDPDRWLLCFSSLPIGILDERTKKVARYERP